MELFDSHRNYPTWRYCDRYAERAEDSYSKFFCAFRLTEAFFASSTKQGSANKNQWEDMPRFEARHLLLWMREAGMRVEDTIDADMELLRREENFIVRATKSATSRGAEAFLWCLREGGNRHDEKYVGFLHPAPPAASHDTASGTRVLWVIIETRNSAEADRKIREKIAEIRTPRTTTTATAPPPAVAPPPPVVPWPAAHSATAVASTTHAQALVPLPTYTPPAAAVATTTSGGATPPPPPLPSTTKKK